MNAVLNEAPSIFMWIASAFAVFFSCVVYWSNNPIACAVALMGTLFSTAALYFAIGNYFIGAVQILVYAGAIAVLFVFIVMLLDLKPHKLRSLPGQGAYLSFVTIVAAGLAALLFCTLAKTPSEEAGTAFQLSAKNYSEYFLSHYQVAFQAAGLLVFAAILGAIQLARGHFGKKENT